jgi:hypothetical protein
MLNKRGRELKDFKDMHPASKFESRQATATVSHHTLFPHRVGLPRSWGADLLRFYDERTAWHGIPIAGLANRTKSKASSTIGRNLSQLAETICGPASREDVSRGEKKHGRYCSTVYHTVPAITYLPWDRVKDALGSQAHSLLSNYLPHSPL